MLADSPITNVIIVLAIALGVIVVVDMVVLPAVESHAACLNGSRGDIHSHGRCIVHP